MQHVFRLTESLGFVFLVGNSGNLWACISIEAISLRKRNFLMIKLSKGNNSLLLSVTYQQWVWLILCSFHLNILWGYFLCKFFYLLFSLPMNDWGGGPLKRVPFGGFRGGIQFHHDLRGSIKPFLCWLCEQDPNLFSIRGYFFCLLSCPAPQIYSQYTHPRQLTISLNI